MDTEHLSRKAERYERSAEVQEEIAREAKTPQRQADYQAAAHYWQAQVAVLRRVAQRKARETW